MRLRAKTLLIVGATLTGLTSLSYVVARTLVMGNFDAIEADAVRQNLERAQRALQGEVASLQQTTLDYAAWDETYRFAREQHPDYLARQLLEEGQAEQRVAAFAIFDLRGVLLHGRIMDPEGRRRVPLPSEIVARLVEGGLLFRDAAARQGRSGVLALPDGVWIVAACPILDNTRSQPARGTFVMGRPLDAGLVRALAEKTRLDLEVRGLGSLGVPPDLLPLGPGVPLVRPVSEERIDGHAVVGDVNGRPAVALAVGMPRTIHERARTTLAYFTVSLLVVGLAFGLSMIILIETVVLSRIERLASSVHSVREQGSLGSRIEASGRDEIAELGRSINALLATVEEAQVELHEGQERYRRSEERYSLAARAASDGLWDWSVTEGEAYFSPRFKEMLGYGEAELGPRPSEWLSRVHPEDQAALQLQLDAADSGSPSEIEHRILHKDGTYRWSLSRWVTLRSPDGVIVRRVGSLSDIAARRVAEEHLRRQALFDALTGLPNRALLLDLLRRALARSRRHPEETCGLLFIDVDRFKYVNDSLGHAAGDQLLCELARRIERCVRPEDTVARLAGDEFVVLLESLRAPSDATRVAERIQGEVGQPIRLGEAETFASVSIGIAIGSGGDQGPEDLIRAADTAMYRAKALGRSGHQVFDSRMHEEATTLLNLEHNLRHALERSEFEVHYQPIVRIESSKIVGFEALVRWRHPTRGLVSPGQFVPLAEESGLIVAIGQWVLERACADGQEWQQEFGPEPPLTLSVNLSARQLVELDLREKVDAVLRRTGFDPGRLHLEITESAIMRRPDHVTVVLGQLKDMGIHVSIDDFGTGYSSLSYLHLFPVDFLKIDRSFVTSMQTVAKQRRIVETILLLARNLGVGVIAEGVEEEAQRVALHALGCVLGQGYLFSKPVNAEGVRGLLTKGIVPVA